MSRSRESVWSYPRPPAVRRLQEPVTIELGGVCVAACEEVLQVLETSHPPTYYLPRSAFADGSLVAVPGTTVCEFKGQAHYFDVLAGGRRARRAAWHYPHPAEGYDVLAGHVAVMPAPMDRCTVAGEVVLPQEGGFYGGWITSWLDGPFKGAPGTWGW